MDDGRDDEQLDASDGLVEVTMVGRAVGHELGKIDEIAVGSQVGITVGSLVGDELREIDGSTDGSDNGTLDGTDESVSLEVLLGFRLDKVDESKDGTNDGRDDGPLVAMGRLEEETMVGRAVEHELGKIDGSPVGALVGITVG
jgi:hypothetical protein